MHNKEWADVEEWAKEGISSWDVCLIDLRDQLNELSDDSVELSKSVAFTNRAICRRLEKLEEAARAAAKYPEKPDSFQMPSQEQVDAARRPQPPSLKEQALAIVTRGNQALTREEQSTIRCALEQLND